MCLSAWHTNPPFQYPNIPSAAKSESFVPTSGRVQCAGSHVCVCLFSGVDMLECRQHVPGVCIKYFLFSKFKILADLWLFIYRANFKFYRSERMRKVGNQLAPGAMSLSDDLIEPKNHLCMYVFCDFLQFALNIIMAQM